MQSARDTSLYYSTMHQAVRFNTCITYIIFIFFAKRDAPHEMKLRELQNTLITNQHLSPPAREKVHFSIVDTLRVYITALLHL